MEPKLIKFISKSDYGEYGAANCPHCGAKGRYVYRFICDDGTEHSAMAGCIKKFPLHFLAKEQKRIMDKQAQYDAIGRSLPSWDIEILSIQDKRIAGEIGDRQAKTLLEIQKRRMANARKW